MIHVSNHTRHILRVQAYKRYVGNLSRFPKMGFRQTTETIKTILLLVTGSKQIKHFLHFLLYVPNFIPYNLQSY